MSINKQKRKEKYEGPTTTRIPPVFCNIIVRGRIKRRVAGANYHTTKKLLHISHTHIYIHTMLSKLVSRQTLNNGLRLARQASSAAATQQKVVPNRNPDVVSRKVFIY